MSAFDTCKEIEREGMMHLIPLLASRCDGHYVKTDKGRLSYKFQTTYGDIIANNKAGEMVAIEIKTEREYTGNFFIERWSNWDRLTPGWGWTLDADVLWYFFLDRMELFEMAFPPVRTWLQNNDSSHFLIEQKKHNQLNNTAGVLVKIEHAPRKFSTKIRRTWLNPRGENGVTILLPEPEEILLFTGVTT